MAAAAFRGTLKFLALGSKRTINYPVTVSDVNAAFYIFPDGNNIVQLPSNEGNILLVDIILSAAGTDTTTASIFVNGKNTGELVQNSANLATNVARQFIGSPIGFQPGAQVRFTQNT